MSYFNVTYWQRIAAVEIGSDDDDIKYLPEPMLTSLAFTLEQFRRECQKCGSL